MRYPRATHPPHQTTAIITSRLSASPAPIRATVRSPAEVAAVVVPTTPVEPAVKEVGVTLLIEAISWPPRAREDEPRTGAVFTADVCATETLAVPTSTVKY